MRTLALLLLFPLLANAGEIRLGALVHDVDLVSFNRETGYDINAEFLFDSPQILEKIYSPRPNVGISVNSKGNTSQVKPV